MGLTKCDEESHDGLLWLWKAVKDSSSEEVWFTGNLSCSKKWSFRRQRGEWSHRPRLWMRVTFILNSYLVAEEFCRSIVGRVLSIDSKND